MKKTILTYQYKDGSPSVPVYIDYQGFLWKENRNKKKTIIYWENLHRIKEANIYLSNFKENINNVYCFALDNGKIGIRFCLSDLPNRKYNLEDILE